jgi:peptidoglycan pentaglycine glycine transferase (the first glycine)
MTHSYTVEHLTDHAVWEQLILRLSQSLFVQSWEYGKFYEAMGESYLLLVVKDEDEKVVGGSIVLTTRARRGSFLYLPYGPWFLSGDAAVKQGVVRALTDFLKPYAKTEGYHFVRISPYIEDTPSNRRLYDRAGYRRAPMHILAETTWVLDVTMPEDQLLAGMKKNHRNLIRRCQRDGVVVSKKSDSAALDRFNSLFDGVAKRHDFHRFSRSYIQKEWTAFQRQDQIKIWEARLPDGRLDASAIVLYYGNTAVYRHAASANLDKRLPTAYLLQWHAIVEAKKRGCHWYNFWGIAPPDAARKHPFAGISHFKRGFGGEQHTLLPCMDLPVSPRYMVNWTVETLRRKRRGF